jgi:NAD(P)-dependent dehydrogenase (short-subunit alcohol dehydrogenase family)
MNFRKRKLKGEQTMRLKNKIAFVTGGSRGIGEAIVRRFAEEGATVVSGDIRKPTCDLPKAVEHIDLDVTTEAGWKSAVGHAVGKHGRIDILVNNAGFATIEPLLEVTLDNWNKAIALHQTGMFLGMREVIPHMVEQHAGSIINLSSIWGIRAAPVAFSYQTVKAAIRHMSKSAAITHVGDGIRVNSIHPGGADTPLLNLEFPKEAIDSIIANCPMGRLAKPIEVANGVLFLASDEASFITGIELCIDGGGTAK